MRKYVREKYMDRLKAIAETSVLPNVGGTARGIINSLNVVAPVPLQK